jgi:hypothetical protein
VTLRTITLTGRYAESDGDPAVVKIRFTPTSALKSVSENLVVLPDPVYAQTDALGNFKVVLYPMQTGLAPADFLYKVEELDGRKTVSSWYMRLDPETPDAITLTSVYPSQKPAFTEIYPTLDDVRSIASDLDNTIYSSLADLQTNQNAYQAMLDTKLGIDDLGSVVPTMQDGQILPEYLPSIRYANTFTAGSQVEMLGKGGVSQGDVCIRYDSAQRFVLVGDDSTIVTNWVLLSDNFSVSSVNGKAGQIVLTATDVGAAALNHGHDVLSGSDYVATNITGDVVTSNKRLELGDTGDITEATNRSVTWKAADGTVMFAIRPFEVTPWSAIPIQVFTSAGVLITGATLTAHVRKLNPDTAEFRITAAGITGSVYFTTTDAGVNASMTDAVIGQWVSQDSANVILASGVVGNSNGKVTPIGMNLTSLTHKVQLKGTLPGTFLTTSQVYKPVNAADMYSLDVATVESGELDAFISGSWPHQQLHLTIPNGEVGPRGFPGPAGPTGPQGPAGATSGVIGPTGPAGKSAYQSWLDLGYIGTEADFLLWIASQAPSGGGGGTGGTEILLDSNGMPYFISPDATLGAVVVDGSGNVTYNDAVSASGTLYLDGTGWPTFDTDTIIGTPSGHIVVGSDSNLSLVT